MILIHWQWRARGEKRTAWGQESLSCREPHSAPHPRTVCLSSFPSLAYKEHSEIMVAEVWPQALVPLMSPVPQVGLEEETQDKTLCASSHEPSG